MSSKKIANFEKAFAEYQKLRGPWLSSLPESRAKAWLAKAQESADRRWLEEGLPTRRDEQWMYTSVAALQETPIQAVDGTGPVPSRLPLLGGDTLGELVFLNGRFLKEASRLPAESGLAVGTVREALSGARPELADSLADLEQAIAGNKRPETVFGAMNTSFLQDGVVIAARSKFRAAKPLVLTFVSTGVAAEGAPVPMGNPRVFAHFAPFSEMAVIENYVSLGAGQVFTNTLTDAYLAPGARVSYCKIQHEGGAAHHIGGTRFYLSSDSWLETQQISLGARLSRQDLYVRLGGAGAEAVVDGVYLVKDKQHVDNHTWIDHAVAHTASDQLYKGILDDESRAVFNGRVYIEKDAQKSNSAQLNKNLMLSKKAEVDTKPELEIFADDVKAAHGATIGQLDKEQLFYFETRAIPEERAVQMLAGGFALDVVYRMRNEAVRDLVSGLVRAKFAELKVVRK